MPLIPLSPRGRRPTPSRRLACGTSLIEVLIALLVVTVGLLGMVGLQAYSLKTNTSAYNRSLANSLAYDILDAMRANRQAALANLYDISIGEPPPSSATRRHERDLVDWKALLEYQIRGDGAVDCETANPVCTVIVQWNDSRVGTGGVLQQLIVSTRL